ncbi:MAG: hypothetical protein IJU48_06120 [Synergistaceae bacterium]|nr:hypothetical protein [Synergistaceae bacterium]
MIKGSFFVMFAFCVLSISMGMMFYVRMRELFTGMDWFIEGVKIYD